MARLEPITLDKAKAHLKVLHEDEDGIIEDYIASARARCEVLTGLTLTHDEGEDPPEINPTILQAMRLLIGSAYHDRDGLELWSIRTETTVQNLLFNARLMVSELPDG